MLGKIAELAFYMAIFASSAAGQVVTGSEFTLSPNDTFTDPPNTMSHYGLTWADFSNGTIGPSAMLSGYGGINLYTVGTRRLTITTSGNVGIGTASPSNLLSVNGDVDIGTRVKFDNANAYGGASAVFGLAGPTNNRRFLFYDYISGTPLMTVNDAASGAGVLIGPGYITGGGTPNTAPANGLAIQGRVGIGTTTPGYALDVVGQVRASNGLIFPDGSTQTTAFNTTLCGGDYAESIDVTGDRSSYAPGDILVIDPNVSGKFLKSAEPYSTAVLGIYSTKPGAVGRRQTTPKGTEEVPMAMMGIVPAKVSAENGAIKPGDLLVSASTPGYAMKGTDRSRMLGAVIGKALGSLNSGTGVIEVGVTLQ
jgi:hypothetical protein